MVEAGKIYKHYKGNLYKVLYIATHAETNEQFIVYHNIIDSTENQKIWLRPLTIFTERIIVNGINQLRFILQKDIIY